MEARGHELCKLPGRNSYYIRWYEGRSRRYRSTGHRDLDKAEEYLAAYLARIQRPADGLVESLLAKRLQNLKASAKTSAAQAPTWHRSLNRHLAKRDAESLTPNDIANFAAARRNEGISNGAIRRELQELRAAISWAMKNGWIASVPTIDLPPDNPARERYLNAKEARRLLDATEAVPHLHLFCALALATGARATSIFELTWDRVELQGANPWVDFRNPNRPATKKRRTTTKIGAKLAAKLAEAKRYAETDHVIEFHGAAVRSIKRSLSSACKRAGLPGVSAHVLKHSCVSILSEKGFSLQDIADFTVTDIKTIELIYRKFSPHFGRDMANALDDLS